MANILSIPDKTTGHKGRGRYTRAKANARKDKRRDEAEARQAKYDALSVAQKIAQAEGKKELLRLSKMTDKATKDNTIMAAVAEEVPASTTLKPRHTPKSKVVAADKTKRPSKS